MKILFTGASGFIGANFMEFLLEEGIEFINVDWNPPYNDAYRQYWKECDIMDFPKLLSIFQEFQPTAVVHFAARTDTDIYDLEGDIDEYIQNTLGTQHVLNCIKATPSVERTIITSTQFVCEAGYLPQHAQDYKPYTLYGKSKMLSEYYTRDAGLDCIWTIIRPSTIWGPWALRYRDVMFKVMRSGLYFHPSKKEVYRSYGYVKNVVYQIYSMLTSEPEKVHQQVFYVGDEPINLPAWVHTISKHLIGKKARVIPTAAVKSLAVTGDILRSLNISFPITSTRFNSMVKDYITPIDKTINAFGTPPYSMEDGVKEMVDWYFNQAEGVKYHEKKIAKALETSQVPS